MAARKMALPNMKLNAQNLIPNLRSGHQLIQRPSSQKQIRSSAAKVQAGAMKALPLIAMLLVGCGLDPEYITRQAATLSDGRLMDKWHSKIKIKRNSMMQETAVMHEEVARNEALKRGIVRPSMVKNIHDGMATIGMTRLEAVAAWGSPWDINTTTTARGRHEQWCYGGVTGSGYVPMSFLYFENGILTTIQN